MTTQERIEELEQYGDARSLGALAYCRGTRLEDNPFWEARAPRSLQDDRATEWEAGWLEEAHHG